MVLTTKSRITLGLTILLVFLVMNLFSSNLHETIQTGENSAIEWSSAQKSVQQVIAVHERKGCGKTRRFDYSTPTFRENLLPGRKYVTPLLVGGLCNQLIVIMKGLYLAKQLGAIGILQDHGYPWTHETGEEVPFSEFFAYDEFCEASGLDILDWRDLKTPSVPTIDPLTATEDSLIRIRESTAPVENLSCFGQRKDAISPLGGLNINTTWFSYLTTEMSYDELRLNQMYPPRELNTRELNEEYSDREPRPALPQDEQVLCHQNLFGARRLSFENGVSKWEPEVDLIAADDPVWTEIGKHFKFSKTIEALTDDLIAQTLNLGPTQRTFTRLHDIVTIHVRQGDFLQIGRMNNFSFQAFVEAVNKIQTEIQTQRDLSKPKILRGRGKFLPVLITTDAVAPEFFANVTLAGWHHVNHTQFRTNERFSRWHASVLDQALLSRGKGFVGTHKSTYSYQAGQRVASWNAGPVIYVKTA